MIWHSSQKQTTRVIAGFKRKKHYTLAPGKFRAVIVTNINYYVPRWKETEVSFCQK